ncbi:hypothetical protein J2X69_004089 [Algoriphagus sp. 4150]|uniref:hypothetical protein n=1 Tax=Algoriphagus sp. 4150 TaxID=2817756 RepID=UPI00285FDCF7|nr:hypothetical protein [Algoriphagus sp. 4150]MDR7131724.1 hypothetical protein [Algoriphagus sp. 4150]
MNKRAEQMKMFLSLHILFPKTGRLSEELDCVATQAAINKAVRSLPYFNLSTIDTGIGY